VESSPSKQAHELGHLWRHAHGFEPHMRVCGGKDTKNFIHKGLADVGHAFKVKHHGLELKVLFYLLVSEIYRVAIFGLLIEVKPIRF
jgi:hypothetical protein